MANDLTGRTQNATERLRLGVRVNTWTSGGGQVFSRELVQAIGRHPSRPEITLFVSGSTSPEDWPTGVEIVDLGPHGGAVRGRLTRARAMRSALASHPMTALLCPGTEIASARHTLSVLWPLTVAPFESSSARRVLGGDARFHRARWLLLRQVMGHAFAGAQAAVYSSQYALDLHKRFIPRARSVPSRVIHPAPSLHVELAPKRMLDPAPDGTSDAPLLYVSRLYPYKMVVEMIEGYAIAARHRTDVPRLLIAGRAIDDNYAEKIRATIGQHGLEQRVVLLGELGPEQLAKLYRTARAFVFPSLVENAGSYALIDAFAYGLPVISSNSSSMPEICGAAALYFDPRQPAELAQRIGEFLDSPELECKLSKLSRERIDWFPDWDAIASQFLEFVENLVAQRVTSNKVGERP